MRILQNILVIGTLLGGLIQASEPRETALPQALLITGNGNDRDHHYAYPPWNHAFYNEKISEILQDIAQVTVTEDLSLLNDGDLGRYDLIINNSMFLNPSPDQFAAFYRFIDRGGSYLAVHAGLVSFLNSERYEQLMGGKFIGGDDTSEFEVFTFDSWYGYDYNDQVQHPITRGVANFNITDELYLVEFSSGEVEVVARARNHPVMWWRPWGDGKALFLTLGHGLSALENEGYQTLLRNGVRWLAGYPILGTVPDGRFPIGVRAVERYIDLNDIASHASDAPLRYAIIDNSNPELVRASIDTENRIRLEFAENKSGTAALKVQARDPKGLWDTADFEIAVTEIGTGNLARYHGVKARASSNETRKFTADPHYAIDGRLDTRWSSDYEDPSWICVDLGQSYLVDRVTLQWEGAFARQYEIQVSGDGERWTTVFAEQAGDGGVDEIAFDPASARYVRMYGDRRATRWGYSLYEFEIYGSSELH